MSLYAIDQRVWVKSEKSLGTIAEAYYGYNRKAVYMVKLVGRSMIYLTNPTNLRAANWCCDACNRWLPGYPYRTAPDGEYPTGLHFCFLCVEVNHT